MARNGLIFECNKVVGGGDSDVWSGGDRSVGNVVGRWKQSRRHRGKGNVLASAALSGRQAGGQ